MSRSMAVQIVNALFDQVQKNNQIAENREVFWVFGLLSPRPCPEEKRVWKLMVNELKVAQ